MEKLKEKNFISIVAYICNDENKIENFLEKIYKVISENFDKYEIILVNDASTDGSIKKLKNYCASMKDSCTVNLINMSSYQGIEMAMNAGIDLAIGDFVYEFDNILVDYALDTVLDVYYHSLKGFDIVSASPTRKMRKSSTFFYKLFNKYSSSKYKLQTETFRIISRRGLNRVSSLTKTIPYRKAVYANCGLNVYTIKYKSINNCQLYKSEKKEKFRKELAIDSLILFTNVAYKFSLGMTFIFLISCALVAIYALIARLISHPISGWTTTIIFMSFGFFGIFLFLSIIIRYASVIIELIFKKQQYMIESIEKITKK